MIIFREEVEKQPILNRRNAPKFKTDDGLGIGINVNRALVKQGRENAFPSGNLFESLAKTNPELFDRKKINQLRASQNMVEDFAKYFDWIYTNQIGKVEQFMANKPEIQTGDKDAVNEYVATFNTSLVSGLLTDMTILVQEHGMSEEEAKQAVFKAWVPDSTSEEGIKKILDARIKNNKILTDSLTKMIKMNYRVFQLTEAEAVALIEDLENDDTNHEAIGKIKDFLKNPKLLEKFKIGKNNYDFRSIGGACIFLSDDDSIKFSQHPSKNLDRIFKYDAIIVGHGDTEDGSSVSSAVEIKDNKSYEKYLSSARSILKKLASAYEDIDLDDEDYDFDEVTKNTIREFIRELNSICEGLEVLIDNNNEDSVSDSRIGGYNYNVVKNLYTRTNEIMYKYKEMFSEQEQLDAVREAKTAIKKFLNLIKSKSDPKQAIKDGKSTEWTVQPISTLNASGLDTIVDIVRQLKKEGFKNVYIGACNPGKYNLPKDLVNDKDFKVTFGMANVFLENDFIDSEDYKTIMEMEIMIDDMLDECGRDYENFSLNELYNQYDKLSNDITIHEGVVDKVKEISKKAWQIIVSIWNKVIGFIKNIASTIYKKITSRFNKSKKLKKPVKTKFIEMKQGKPAIVETTINSTDDLNTISRDKIKSFVDSSKKILSDQKAMNDKIQVYIDRRRSGYKPNGKVVDVKYKDIKESTIFKDIIFI